MNPVDGFIQIEWVPAKLIGDVVELFCVCECVVGACFLFGKVLVCRSGKDTINPGLSVLTSRGSEGRSGQLFCVEAVRGFLGRIVAYGEGSLNGFGSTYVSDIRRSVLFINILVVGIESILV